MLRSERLGDRWAKEFPEAHESVLRNTNKDMRSVIDDAIRLLVWRSSETLLRRTRHGFNSCSEFVTNWQTGS